MTNKKVSDTWCILPWVHLSTRPDGQTFRNVKIVFNKLKENGINL